MNEKELDVYLFNREKRTEMFYFNDEWNIPSSSNYEHLEDNHLIGGLTSPSEKSDWWSKINNKNDK